MLSTSAKRACLLFLASNLVFLAEAQAERLPIAIYTTAEGLPRDRIDRIVQDSKGFMWFCTPEGLSRFDGYKFTNYGIEQGLAARGVNDFLETRDGLYLAATDKGLCRFIPDPLPQGQGSQDATQRFEVYYPGSDDLSREINLIYEDHAGTIWCGTYAGLFRLDRINSQWVFSFVDVVRPLGVSNDRLVRSITEDHRGYLWVGAESGVYRRSADGVVDRYGPDEGLPKAGNGRMLLEDRSARIWVGTASGLYQLVADPKPNGSVVERVYTTKDGLPDNGRHLAASNIGRQDMGGNQAWS